MLGESEAACGASPVLLRNRNKFRRFFSSLPDPTRLGYSHLLDVELQAKYKGDLAVFYHHVSEKHCGELIQLVRREMTLESAHPQTPRFSEDGRELDLVPEVHSEQFFSPKADPNLVAEATNFFKDKWWRNTSSAASGAGRGFATKCRVHRLKFIQKMRQCEKTVWKPTSDGDDNRSRTNEITFHSLDSLVWSLLTDTSGSVDDLGDTTFADVYLFFCRCPLLAYKRHHSTPGRVSREKSQRQKGQPAAAKGGGKKGQPAAAKGGRIHGMGKASGSLGSMGKGWKGFGGH